MNNSPEKHPIANDLINLVIAIVPWMFPDSPAITKVLISIVFCVIVVISRRNPDFVTNLWSPFYYFMIVCLPIAFGVLTWTIYNIVEPNTLFESTSNIFILGLGFGAIVGVPLTIYGAYVEQTSKNTLFKYLLKSVRGGYSGCLIQILTTIILVTLIIYMANKEMLPTTIANNGDVLIPFDGFPPSILGTLGSTGPFIFHAITAQDYNFMWVISTFILNLFFVIIGFALGKMRARFIPKNA